jgi:glyoxylase-like metal-dependent hydrolase (beta-lactamase superfamily II)
VHAQRETGRGERVLDGVWRLRLPLPWPGVPHCNAWALRAGDGIVLVDTGMHDEHSGEQLDVALAQVGLSVEQVRLVVCTHAHTDHCGEAAIVARRAGCEVWMHPDRGHLLSGLDDPDARLAGRMEVARTSGVPDEPLRRWAQARRHEDPGVALPLEVARDLVDGVVVESDLGPWAVHETPGHAPSHVVLHQRERRLLLSGDHVLGRVSLYFDYGYTPDPVGEYLASLDRTEALGARLGLSGHGRPFADVPGHIDASRSLVRERLDAVRGVVDAGPRTAYEVARAVYGELFMEVTSTWLMTKTLCYLTHLEQRGEVERLPPERRDDPERWARS